MLESAFYCVANARHFLGAVALVNSLRLNGHEEPIFVGDCGLAPAQRDFLAREATVLETEPAASAHLLKWCVPRRHPARVAVLLDADLIVTRSLAPLLDEGGAGRFAAFADPVSNRFHSEWEDLPGLGPIRRHRYANAGVIVLPSHRGDEILDLVERGQATMDVELTASRGGTSSYPFYFADQDVWNAVFGARLEPDELCVLPAQLAPHPPFAGLRLLSPTGLDCAYADGVRPFVLHHVARKPWLEATPHNLYARLMQRLLTAPDLPLRLDEHQVPRRFRDGPLGSAERGRVAIGAFIWSHRGRLGLRRRLASVRARKVWAV